MKKTTLGLILAMLAAAPLCAQREAFHEAVTTHYRVLSEISEAHARETAVKLEAMFAFYNSLFRFEPGTLATRLRARFFSTKEAYDNHLRGILGQTRVDFVYLHYGDPERSELVGFAAPAETFDSFLNHQGFIQFLRSFVANPPLWMREGFAVFFEKSRFDPATGAVRFRENLAWLETLQAIARSGNLMPLPSLLALDIDQARADIEVFYPQAWGFAAYLMDPAFPGHRRLLWDAIRALRADADLPENVRRVNEGAVRWYAAEELAAGFRDFIDYKRSFRALVEEGVAHYARDEFDYAEESFYRALELDETMYLPYYYLGLIYHSRQNYPQAHRFFEMALARNAPAGLTLYAMGVNAYAAKRPDDALGLLLRAREADPSYREKADELIARIRR